MEQHIAPLEVHAFGNFIPSTTRFLVVGTFPGRQFTQRTEAENLADPLAFSYGGRNQFWRIMEVIYGVPLVTRADKQALLTQYAIGMTDLIAACRRKNASNADQDLFDIVWNKAAIEQIIAEQPIEKVFCTGKAVAKVFQAWFPLVDCVALPSPSPLYASMRLETKLTHYQNAFPHRREAS